MWQRFTPYDLRVIGHYLGTLLLFFAALMALPLATELVKEAMTVFILYVITYVIGALVGIAHGFEAIPAIFESVAMTSNGGIITSVAGPGMAGTLELFYIFQMWAGRLEFMTLFALIVEVVASLVPRPRPKERS